MELNAHLPNETVENKERMSVAYEVYKFKRVSAFVVLDSNYR